MILNKTKHSTNFGDRSFSNASCCVGTLSQRMSSRLHLCDNIKHAGTLIHVLCNICLLRFLAYSFFGLIMLPLDMPFLHALYYIGFCIFVYFMYLCIFSLGTNFVSSNVILLFSIHSFGLFCFS